jgi:hypothetical protein
VKEFEKTNPTFFSSINNEAYPQKNDTSLEEFLEDQQDRISSPVYDYLPCNINHDSNKH